MFETALGPGELLTEIRIPKPAAVGWSFQKFTKRAIDWAIVGVAVQGGSVALAHMADTPLRAAAVEQALAAGAARGRRPRQRPREPGRSTTSTPAAAIASTWRGSWSAGPWRKPRRAASLRLPFTAF